MNCVDAGLRFWFRWGGKSNMSNLESRAAGAGLIFAAFLVAFLIFATLGASGAPSNAADTPAATQR
jgi:hypothetical protein